MVINCFINVDYASSKYNVLFGSVPTKFLYKFYFPSVRKYNNSINNITQLIDKFKLFQKIPNEENKMFLIYSYTIFNVPLIKSFNIHHTICDHSLLTKAWLTQSIRIWKRADFIYISLSGRHFTCSLVHSNLEVLRNFLNEINLDFYDSLIILLWLIQLHVHSYLWSFYNTRVCSAFIFVKKCVFVLHLF